MGLRPANAVSTTIVISQAYGGGGNSGATLKNDFIELHNVGTASVDVTGWTIQYSSATGNFPAALVYSGTNPSTNATLLSGTIPGGGYYLVQEAAGAGGTTNLPTPDATGAIAMSGSNFKIALVSDANPLGAVACPTGSSIVDMLGVGSATCSETAAAPVLSNTTAALRKSDGCQDTDNNSADFITGPPAPRNSSSPLVICGVVLTGPTVSDVVINPASGVPGATGIAITATAVAGTNGAVATVTADLTPIGGTTATLTNTTGNSYAGTFTVPAAAPFGQASIVVTATDSGSPAKTGAGTTTFTVIDPNAPITVGAAVALPRLTVAKVRGIVTAISNGNAYIQDPDGTPGARAATLFDGLTIDGTSIDATGLQLGQDITFMGTMDVYHAENEITTMSGLTINASGVALPAVKTVTLADLLATPSLSSDLVKVDELTVVSISTTGAPAKISGGGNSALITVADASGKQATVYLHRNATAGAAIPYPGVPANPIPATVVGTGTTSVVTFDGIKVGDIYSVTGPAAITDFTPSINFRPRDANDFIRTGVGLISATSATPPVVARGSITTLGVTTSVPVGPTVTVDLTPLGGSATQPLTNDGTGNFTYDLLVSGSAPLGPAKLNVTATNGTKVGNAVISLTVVTPVVEVTNIAQARAVADYTQVHIITGVATAVGTTGAGQSYIQDSSGGLYLFNNLAPLAANIGDPIDATGFKVTFSGSVEVDWSYTGASAASTGNGTPLTPATVTTAGWPSKVGQLVVNTGLYVISGTATSGTASFTVSDGTSVGQLFVHTNAKLTTYPVAGHTYSVTGISDYYKTASADAWQLKVRMQSDLVEAGTAPAAIPVKLAFTAQPVGTPPGVTFATPLAVTVQTSAGATASAFTGPVNLVIKSGTGTAGAVLSGAASVNAVNGVATFSGLSIDLAGTGYVLTATSTGKGASLLTPANSTAFTIGQTVLYGDIDKSGAVTEADAVLALKVYAGLVPGNDPTVSIVNGDVFPTTTTPDGKIDLLDVMRIIRTVNHLDTLQ
jgi:hypothetical protein